MQFSISFFVWRLVTKFESVDHAGRRLANMDLQHPNSGSPSHLMAVGNESELLEVIPARRKIFKLSNKRGSCIVTPI
jgi:hypothetical protein